MCKRVAIGLLLSFSCLSAGLRATPPSVSAVRIETPPVWDGRVNNEEWGAAPTASDFVQQRPALGKPATENTEIRFLYTQDALYIGVICFDSEPDKIVDTQSRRDGNLNDSDSILIILDTYNDKPNGFLFGTHPSGIQYDAQILNEGASGGQVRSTSVGRSVTSTSARGNVAAFNLNWNTTWTLSSSRTEPGWETQIEIPLTSVGFKNSEEPQR